MTTFRELEALAAAVEADGELAWRMTRVARRAEYDLGGTAVDAFAHLVASEPRVLPVLEQIDRAYEVIVRGGNREYALARLIDYADEWTALRETLSSGAARAERRRLADIIEAVENHFGARLNYAFDTLADIPLRSSARTLAARAAPKLGKAGAGLRKEVETILQSAGKETKETLAKLGRYLSADDPAWTSLAEFIAERQGLGKQALNIAIEGKLGEHLAMRSPAVWTFFEDAYERAMALAKSDALKGWRFRLVDSPVFGPTKTGGLGEIYDASAWLVREGAGGQMKAMPLMLLQVKAGTVREAIDQISRDVGREFGGFVEFLDKSGKAVPHRVVPPVGFESHRVLVAPRAPSSRRIVEGLKPGITVDYAKAPLTKSEIIAAADVLRRGGLRRAKQAAGTATKKLPP
jgi:hypothetical protein